MVFSASDTTASDGASNNWESRNSASRRLFCAMMRPFLASRLLSEANTSPSFTCSPNTASIVSTTPLDPKFNSADFRATAVPEVVNVVAILPRSTVTWSNVGTESTEPSSTYHSVNPQNPPKIMPVSNNNPISSFGIL